MVVVVDGLAASGGYIAALASDHIIAQSSSLVGSIGVLFQYPNFSDLMKTVGVKVEEIKSSPLKAAPSVFEPTSAGSPRRDRGARDGFLRLVQEVWCATTASWMAATLARSPTAASSPAARPSISS